MPEDIFSRETVAEQMSDVICSGKVTPVVFNGPWGCGKTTHAMRIERCINNKYSDTHKCIYWNAAKSDFARDPLPAFVAALSAYVDDNTRESFEKHGYELCRVVWGTASLHLISQICNKFIGADPAKIYEVIDNISSELNSENFQRKCFRDFLQTAREEDERINSAKSLIKSIAQDKTLVVIIDELDRCRPDFALKMIEHIKHLFDSSDCVFILVMNKVSMCSSVNHVYGLNAEESERYLNKFFQLELFLPSVDKNNGGQNCSYSYLLHLLANADRLNMSTNPLMDDFIQTVVRHNKLQLREVEKMVNTLQLLFEMRNANFGAQNNPFLSLLICVVSYLVSLNHDLRRLLLERDVSPDRALELLGYKISDPPGNGNIHHLCLEYLRLIMRLILSSSDKEKSQIVEQFVKQNPRTDIFSVDDQFNYFANWLNYSTFLS